MSKPGCERCGAKVGDRPAPEFSIALTGTPLNTIMATVQFRRHTSFVDAYGTPHNFASLETAQLNYSLIAALLGGDRTLLTFRKQPEQMQFYATYPELRP